MKTVLAGMVAAGIATGLFIAPDSASAQMIAYPNEASRAMAQCIERSTDAADRTLTMRWMATSMSAAKDLSDVITVDAAAKARIDKQMGALFTRLFAEDCSEEAAVLMRSGDSAGIEAAGGRLGEMAMAQLMTDPDAMRSLMAYIQHADLAAIANTMR